MRIKDKKKEKAIRQKALETIARHGLDGLSMQKLAKAANVSPATIYLYFENKEDLILQVFAEESRKMTGASLEGFDPEGSFRDGLKIQWLNRARYCMEHRVEMRFLERIRYAPLQEKAMKLMDPAFFTAMQTFVKNAIKRGELVEVPVEVYWSTAFAPLYNLIMFHSTGKSMSGRPFTLSEELLLKTLDLALKALTP